ncbi:DUF7691 family protein [Wolbachia endosymbiont (group A) of Acrocera orbiculus]|uniref:DUF7691 family protein n=1 Tax=Wolbachia endosymbiont (group A) of Acrocera orbiculus TaxID=2953971 RepID=UPI0022272296|nr:hypothetical protein [Wolbachia endosymbiont (group A) of Acrocera orbiculus]
MNKCRCSGKREDVLKVVDDLFDSTELDIKSALKDLILNQPPYSHSADLYHYAFQALCSYFGQELPYYSDFKFGYVTDIVDDILESDFGLSINIVETIINISRDEFFGLPIEGDVVSGLLDRNDLLSLQSQFKKIQITDDLLETLEGFENEKEKDGEPSDKARKAIAYPLIKEIKEHISYCVEGGFDLVSFCY